MYNKNTSIINIWMIISKDGYFFKNNLIFSGQICIGNISISLDIRSTLT